MISNREQAIELSESCYDPIAEREQEIKDAEYQDWENEERST